jgi:hypothetical protein
VDDPNAPLYVSPSSAETVLSCEQKYVHDKVLKTPVDADASSKEKMDQGSAFHWVLEKTWHEESEWTRELCMQACEKYDTLDPVIHGAIIGAAHKQYYRVHKKSCLEVVAVEHEIFDDNVIGYIDATLVDKNDWWWMCDMKSKGSWKESYAVDLHEDLQLNTYALFAEEVAKDLKLDPRKFAGCLYRVAQMPPKPKTVAIIPRGVKNLTPEEIEAARFDSLANRLQVAMFQAVVRVEDMNLKTTWQTLMRARKKMLRLWDDPGSAVRNIKDCAKYQGYQCNWWSRCHGGCLYTDGPIVRITNAETTRDLTRK